MKNVLVLLLTLVYFTSCSPEVDFVEPFTSDEVIDNENDPEEEIVVSKDPCDFTLENAEVGETIIIDCVMDLGRKTISLPSDVTLEYEGGTITNGTLKFEKGQIDGKLLNYELAIEGTVNLIDPVFEFDPSKWDVVQGETNFDTALKNKVELERVISLVKGLSATTLKIDKFDAYFEVGNYTGTVNFYPSEEAINVPSDFNLEMSDRTHLRVYPNSSPKHSLLAVRDASNVTIKGGNLHGDREKHDYSSGGSHEWGHLLDLHAAVDVTISKVKMFEATGDGMDIHSLYFTYDMERYRPSKNIVVKDCLFDNNRRNNLSITDGYHILVENNTFLNAGNNTPSSEGVLPGKSIDVEAFRERDDDGNIIYRERAEDITIRNNIEKGSWKGAFTVHIGYGVIIENNHTEGNISYTYGQNVKIRGNTVTAVSEFAREEGTAIKGGKKDRGETVFGNEISGNIINGYSVGINITNQDTEVFGNTIENFETGIFTVNLSDTNIFNNELVSNRAGSIGIFGHISNLNNVLIEDNYIEVDRNPLKFSNVNMEVGNEEFSFTLRNNTLKSSNNYSLFDQAKGIILDNNKFDHGVEIYDSEKLKILDNDFNINNQHGIHLRDINRNIDIENNTIEIKNSVGKSCIEIQSSTSVAEVKIISNACVE